MIFALLLAAATPQTALDAERAFAAAAKEKGNWTAFRDFADSDAIMFVPQPINAQRFLKPLKDPKQPIDWWPTASWVACDGSYAVNTGGWRQPSGSVGFFSTVWRRQPDEVGGWKWTVDGGGPLKVARARVPQPQVRRAACTGTPTPLVLEHSRPGVTESHGVSLDGTLRWHWTVDAKGARVFEASLWTGHTFERVVRDVIAAP